MSESGGGEGGEGIITHESKTRGFVPAMRSPAEGSTENLRIDLVLDIGIGDCLASRETKSFSLRQIHIASGIEIVDLLSRDDLSFSLSRLSSRSPRLTEPITP